MLVGGEEEKAILKHLVQGEGGGPRKRGVKERPREGGGAIEREG